MFVKGMNYRFKKFTQRFLAAIAAIIFISSDFLIPAVTQAFVPAAAPGLLPIIGDVILFGTAAELATIAAPIIVGGFVIGAAYYYWSQEQTEQAQIKAEEKYCSANPSEQLCDVPPPFTGGQSKVEYNVRFGYIDVLGNPGGFNAQSSLFFPGYNPSFGLYGPIKSVRAAFRLRNDPGFTDQITEFFVTCAGIAGKTTDGTIKEYVVHGIGNDDPVPSTFRLVDLARVDGQPDIGGNLPSSSSLDWKDWPQDKRQTATSLLTDDDLLPILKLGNTGILATGQSFPNGIRFFPGDGQPATFLPGPITVSDHLSQPTPSPSPEPSPSPSPIPLPSPSPEPTPPPPSPEPEPATDGAGATSGGGVIVKTGKWDYFFGRVTSSPKNQARSQKNLNNLKKLGIDEAIGGRNRLRKIFKAGLNAPEVGDRRTNAYGVTVTRKVEIVNGEVQGAIEIGYFYRNGNLSSTPEVTTIIVKIYK